MPSADIAGRAALADAAVRQALLESFREAARQGAATWVEDFSIYVHAWGFDLARVDVPVQLWHGGQDRVVAPAVAHHLAKQLAHCHPHILPREGHYSRPWRHAHGILRVPAPAESP